MTVTKKVLFFTIGLIQVLCYFRGVLTQQYENDSCSPRRCIEVEQCEAAIEGLKKGIHPNICGFIGEKPLTCCKLILFGIEIDGLPEEIKQGSIAVKMCYNYSSTLCPEANTAAVGGEAARPRELPFMAHIGYGADRSDITWQCGGSLVSTRYVLSAAHCTDAFNLGIAKWARLGELDTSTDKDEARPEIFEIVFRLDHPDYNPPQVYNDIALYRLERDVKFNDFIRPICLHASDRTLPQGKILAAGWGRIGFVEKVSAKLLKVELDVLDTSRCSQTGDVTSLPNGIDKEAMICAGSDTGGRDTCLGDSGGPLFSPPKSQFCHLRTQYGVTSFGYQCGLAEFPGVYTRVLHHLKWIESIVWPLNTTNPLVVWSD